MAIDVEARLWGLANVVAGFAVAESIAFLVAFGNRELQNEVTSAEPLPLLLTGGSAVVLLRALATIRDKARPLAAEEDRWLWDWTHRYRVWAVVLSHGFVAAMLALSWSEAVKGG